MLNTKKTVSGILAAFSKTIKELEGVEQSRRLEASRKSEVAAHLVAESNAATAEADRARSVADKLKGIIA